MTKQCAACSENFQWDDDVVEVRDEFYHKDCVELYPTGYVAYLDYECLGETENDDGQPAYDVFKEGEYEEDDDV